MLRRVRRASFAALPLLLGACASTLDATRIGVPVTLASPGTAGTPGATFRVVQHPTYGFFGLATISQPALDKVLQRQLIGAKAITNVRVTTKSRWSDVLLTVLTAGLIVPRTMVVEGTIVPDSLAAPAPAPAK